VFRAHGTSNFGGGGRIELAKGPQRPFDCEKEQSALRQKDSIAMGVDRLQGVEMRHCEAVSYARSTVINNKYL